MLTSRYPQTMNCAWACREIRGIVEVGIKRVTLRRNQVGLDQVYLAQEVDWSYMCWPCVCICCEKTGNEIGKCCLWNTETWLRVSSKVRWHYNWKIEKSWFRYISSGLDIFLSFRLFYVYVLCNTHNQKILQYLIIKMRIASVWDSLKTFCRKCTLITYTQVTKTKLAHDQGSAGGSRRTTRRNLLHAAILSQDAGQLAPTLGRDDHAVMCSHFGYCGNKVTGLLQA